MYHIIKETEPHSITTALNQCSGVREGVVVHATELSCPLLFLYHQGLFEAKLLYNSKRQSLSFV